MRFLRRIQEYTRTSPPMNQLSKIVCDNSSMVRKVHHLLTPSESTCDDSTRHYALKPLQPEWDVLNEIGYSVRGWQGLCITHGKGHQDDTTPMDSLSLEAALNVQAGALAGEYLCRNPSPKFRFHMMFPNMHAHLHLSDCTITYRYALQIRNANCDPPMIAYLKTKYDWTDTTFESINWTVHGKAIRSQRHRKTHITKLVHDILPTN